MMNRKRISFVLALCMMLAIGMPAFAKEAPDTQDVQGNWVLLSAETAKGVPYTPAQMKAIFQSENFMFTLYSNNIACMFSDNMLMDEYMTYEYDGEGVYLSGLEHAPLMINGDSAHMTPTDGSTYTFARQSAIEGMWVLTSAYDNKDRKLTDAEIIEELGGENWIWIFNADRTMDAYLDGKPMQSSVVFETEGDAIVAYDTQTPEDRWDIVFTDAEHFQLTNGHNSTMEFSILYPVIGTWSLVYALDVDGSFLSKKQIFDAFGSNDIAIVIEEEGVGYVAMDGEAQTEPETVSMQAGGTLLLGDDPLKIDISRNILGMDIETEYGTLLFMFARSTPVVIPK